MMQELPCWLNGKTLLLLVLLSLILPASQVKELAFDKDSRDDCSERAKLDYCTKDEEMYFECPLTCASHLAPDYPTTSGVDLHPEVSFYHFSFKDTSEKVIKFASLDGHVVIAAALPLLPGLAQFHYDMLDHLQQLHSWTLEVIIVPMEGQDGVEIKPREGSKVKILLNHDSHYHPLLQYLRGVQERRDVFSNEQANIFTISYDGDYVSLHVSPTITTIQQHVADLLKEMESEEL